MHFTIMPRWAVINNKRCYFCYRWVYRLWRWQMVKNRLEDKLYQSGVSCWSVINLDCSNICNRWLRRLCNRYIDRIWCQNELHYSGESFGTVFLIDCSFIFYSINFELNRLSKLIKTANKII